MAGGHFARHRYAESFELLRCYGIPFPDIIDGLRNRMRRDDDCFAASPVTYKTSSLDATTYRAPRLTLTSRYFSQAPRVPYRPRQPRPCRRRAALSGALAIESRYYRASKIPATALAERAKRLARIVWREGALTRAHCGFAIGQDGKPREAGHGPLMRKRRRADKKLRQRWRAAGQEHIADAAEQPWAD